MRDLSKAMTSFGWWTFIATAHQMLNLVAPDDELRAILEAFGRAGDTIQSGIVDLMFTVPTLNIADPDTWVPR